MPNDHYIPKTLTRPWEHEHEGNQRQLTFLDFSSAEFATRAARRLFARRDLNSEEVETWLTELIDTPVGAYVQECRNGGDLSEPSDPKQERALRLLLLFNTHRLSEARGKSAPLSLQEVKDRGPTFLDQMIAVDDFQMFGFTLPEGQEFCFTEVATFPIPFSIGKAALAIPLGQATP